MTTTARCGLTRVACAAVAGLALPLAGPPWHASFVAFATPGLLLLVLEPSPGDVRRSGQALGLGLVAGTVANAFAMPWIVHVLRVFGGFPWIAAIPTAALAWVAHAMPLALAAAGTTALAARGVPPWLSLPGCISVAYTLTPALFPWRPSVSQIPWLPWVQLAEIGGEPLLDVLWGLVGCGFAEALRRRQQPRWRPALVGFLALIVPAAYGWARIPAVQRVRAEAPVLRVGVVQPNIGIAVKHDPRTRFAQLRLLQTLSRRLEDRGAELVVWPETAYRFPLHRDRRQDPAPPRSLRARGVQGPLLVGAVTRRGRCARWNSAIAMNAGGRIVGIADKVRRLPFGEYVPLWHWLPPLQHVFPCPGLFPGDPPATVDVAGTRVGVLNCYEDILASVAWRTMQARPRPQLLVNVTNDAWFGDTTEPHLHHQVARMRSIEHRRDLIRAVNTGVSGHVTATGRPRVRTETWTRTSFVARARLTSAPTPWMRFGDLTTPALVGALLGTLSVVGRYPVGRES